VPYGSLGKDVVGCRCWEHDSKLTVGWVGQHRINCDCSEKELPGEGTFLESDIIGHVCVAKILAQL